MCKPVKTNITKIFTFNVNGIFKYSLTDKTDSSFDFIYWLFNTTPDGHLNDLLSYYKCWRIRPSGGTTVQKEIKKIKL